MNNYFLFYQRTVCNIVYLLNFKIILKLFIQFFLLFTKKDFSIYKYELYKHNLIFSNYFFKKIICIFLLIDFFLKKILSLISFSSFFLLDFLINFFKKIVIKWHEPTFYLTDKNVLTNIAHILKMNSYTKVRNLSDIVVVDYLTSYNRFSINYNLLSLSFTNRLYLKSSFNDLDYFYSLNNLYKSSIWLEREVWDLFGVFFINNFDLRRILTDYGFMGHPLRRDFPLTGFTELFYNHSKKKIIYEAVNLSQKYRTFYFEKKWVENFFVVDFIFFSILLILFLFIFKKIPIFLFDFLLNLKEFFVRFLKKLIYFSFIFNLKKKENFFNSKNNDYITKFNFFFKIREFYIFKYNLFIYKKLYFLYINECIDFFEKQFFFVKNLKKLYNYKFFNFILDFLIYILIIFFNYLILYPTIFILISDGIGYSSLKIFILLFSNFFIFFIFYIFLKKNIIEILQNYQVSLSTPLFFKKILKNKIFKFFIFFFNSNYLSLLPITRKYNNNKYVSNTELLVKNMLFNWQFLEIDFENKLYERHELSLVDDENLPVDGFYTYLVLEQSTGEKREFISPFPPSLYNNLSFFSENYNWKISDMATEFTASAIFSKMNINRIIRERENDFQLYHRQNFFINRLTIYCILFIIYYPVFMYFLVVFYYLYNLIVSEFYTTDIFNTLTPFINIETFQSEKNKIQHLLPYGFSDLYILNNLEKFDLLTDHLSYFYGNIHIITYYEELIRILTDLLYSFTEYGDTFFLQDFWVSLLLGAFIDAYNVLGDPYNTLAHNNYSYTLGQNFLYSLKEQLYYINTNFKKGLYPIFTLEKSPFLRDASIYSSFNKELAYERLQNTYFKNFIFQELYNIENFNYIKNLELNKIIDKNLSIINFYSDIFPKAANLTINFFCNNFYYLNLNYNEFYSYNWNGLNYKDNFILNNTLFSNYYAFNYYKQVKGNILINYDNMLYIKNNTLLYCKIIKLDKNFDIYLNSLILKNFNLISKNICFFKYKDILFLNYSSLFKNDIIISFIESYFWPFIQNKSNFLPFDYYKQDGTLFDKGNMLVSPKVAKTKYLGIARNPSREEALLLYNKYRYFDYNNEFNKKYNFLNENNLNFFKNSNYFHFPLQKKLIEDDIYINTSIKRYSKGINLENKGNYILSNDVSLNDFSFFNVLKQARYANYMKYYENRGDDINTNKNINYYNIFDFNKYIFNYLFKMEFNEDSNKDSLYLVKRMNPKWVEIINYGKYSSFQKLIQENYNDFIIPYNLYLPFTLQNFLNLIFKKNLQISFENFFNKNNFNEIFYDLNINRFNRALANSKRLKELRYFYYDAFYSLDKGFKLRNKFLLKNLLLKEYFFINLNKYFYDNYYNLLKINNNYLLKNNFSLNFKFLYNDYTELLVEKFNNVNSLIKPTLYQEPYDTYNMDSYLRLRDFYQAPNKFRKKKHYLGENDILRHRLYIRPFDYLSENELLERQIVRKHGKIHRKKIGTLHYALNNNIKKIIAERKYLNNFRLLGKDVNAYFFYENKALPAAFRDHKFTLSTSSNMKIIGSEGRKGHLFYRYNILDRIDLKLFNKKMFKKHNYLWLDPITYLNYQYELKHLFNFLPTLDYTFNLNLMKSESEKFPADKINQTISPLFKKLDNTNILSAYYLDFFNSPDYFESKQILNIKEKILNKKFIKLNTINKEFQESTNFWDGSTKYVLKNKKIGNMLPIKRRHMPGIDYLRSNDSRFLSHICQEELIDDYVVTELAYPNFEKGLQEGFTGIFPKTLKMLNSPLQQRYGKTPNEFLSSFTYGYLSNFNKSYRLLTPNYITPFKISDDNNNIFTQFNAFLYNLFISISNNFPYVLNESLGTNNGYFNELIAHKVSKKEELDLAFNYNNNFNEFSSTGLIIDQDNYGKYKANYTNTYNSFSEFVKKYQNCNLTLKELKIIYDNICFYGDHLHTTGNALYALLQSDLEQDSLTHFQIYANEPNLKGLNKIKRKFDPQFILSTEEFTFPLSKVKAYGYDGKEKKKLHLLDFSVIFHQKTPKFMLELSNSDTERSSGIDAENNSFFNIIDSKQQIIERLPKDYDKHQAEIPKFDFFKSRLCFSSVNQKSTFSKDLNIYYPYSKRLIYTDSIWKNSDIVVPTQLQKAPLFYKYYKKSTSDEVPNWIYHNGPSLNLIGHNEINLFIKNSETNYFLKNYLKKYELSIKNFFLNGFLRFFFISHYHKSFNGGDLTSEFRWRDSVALKKIPRIFDIKVSSESDYYIKKNFFDKFEKQNLFDRVNYQRSDTLKKKKTRKIFKLFVTKIFFTNVFFDQLNIFVIIWSLFLLFLFFIFLYRKFIIFLYTEYGLVFKKFWFQDWLWYSINYIDLNLKKKHHMQIISINKNYSFNFKKFNFLIYQNFEDVYQELGDPVKSFGLSESTIMLNEKLIFLKNSNNFIFNIINFQYDYLKIIFKSKIYLYFNKLFNILFLYFNLDNKNYNMKILTKSNLFINLSFFLKKIPTYIERFLKLNYPKNKDNFYIDGFSYTKDLSVLQENFKKKSINLFLMNYKKNGLIKNKKLFILKYKKMSRKFL